MLLLGAAQAVDTRGVSIEERHSNANREYQRARLAYEKGDFATAEPVFRLASEWAPEFPEPHFALAQLMQRSGRMEEAAVETEKVKRLMPQGGQPKLAFHGSNEGADRGSPKRPLVQHAEETARTLRVARPDVGPLIGRSLVAVAKALEAGAVLIHEMMRSPLQQDQHNGRIHTREILEAEVKLRALIANPLDANGWWQLSLLCFNNRREFESASRAPPPQPSRAPNSLNQQCGQEPEPVVPGHHAPTRLTPARHTCTPVRRADAFEATMRLSQSATSRASFFLLYHAWQHLCDWRDWPMRARQLRASTAAALDGTPGESAEHRAIMGALQPPYVLLVSRLVDSDPMLVLRSFQEKTASVWTTHKHLGADADALAARSKQLALPPADYLQGGQLTVGYLSGVPAGHVTYDLVGHMLQFHKDPRLRVVWYTAHHDTQKVREGSRHEGGLKVPWQDLSSLSGKNARDAAAEVRARRVAVLVDLDGWIGDEPPRAVMASAPAPVRNQWLGWAGSTGDASCHYMVVDVALVPPRQHTYYSERLLLLPRCYQLNDHAQLYRSLLDPPSSPPPPPQQPADADTGSDAESAADASSGDPDGLKAAAAAALSAAAAAAPEVAKALKEHRRREHGIGSGALTPAALPPPPSSSQRGGAGAGAASAQQPPHDAKLTLANFNQLMKVAPDIFAVWAGAMRRTASSTRLMLLTGVTNARVPYTTTTRNLRAELLAVGVRQQRLLGGQAIPKAEHLERARRCSVAVDTLSYNSHTTGADALWAGLPLLTLSGRYLASRVGASLGSSAGLPHAQVASLKAYEDAVAALAAGPLDATDARVPSAPSRVFSATADASAQLQPADTFGTFSLFGGGGGGGGAAAPWDKGVQDGAGHAMRMGDSDAAAAAMQKPIDQWSSEDAT